MRQNQKIDYYPDLIADLERAYQQMMHPFNFFRDWTDVEFRTWCEEGSVEDLKCLKKVLEQHEMFEKCAVVRDLIKTKCDGSTKRK